MNRNLPHGLTDCLLWSDELGMGYHPRPPMDYNGSYFAKYQDMDDTEMGALLTAARVDLVRRYFDGKVVDIGIGGGRFVTDSDSFGYDVNPDAVAWLGDRYLDPYENGADAVTCWDSLEHIPEPEKFLATVKKWLFVSMPTYEGQSDCLASKHFKPGEHIWYWTIRGFIDWCGLNGFAVREVNAMETDIGREGITTFVCCRI